MRDALLSEFDHEMAGTRKTIERVPEEKLGWKPHDKCGTLGWLATHVATLPDLFSMAVEADTFDVAPPSGERRGVVAATSHKELMERFEQSVAKARAALSHVEDETLFKPWSLLRGGQTMFTLPKIGVFRSFMMNHLIHHRGQLTMYLRLLNVPLPALYGPSADEDIAVTAQSR